MLLAKLNANPDLFRSCTGFPRATFETMLELALPFMAAPRCGHPWAEHHRPCVRLVISLVSVGSNHAMNWLEILTGVDDSAISGFLKEARRVWNTMVSARPSLPGFDDPAGGLRGHVHRARPASNGLGSPAAMLLQKALPARREGSGGEGQPKGGCLSRPEATSASEAGLLERNPIPVAFRKGDVYGDKA